MLTIRRFWFVAPIVFAGGLGMFLFSAASHAQPTRTEEIMEQQGKVVRMTTAPKGEVDGAVLENGTQLHWPPHLEDSFTDAIQVGDQVNADGRFETTPHGDRHFEVKSLINVARKVTVENRDFGFGPPPRGRHGHGRGRPGPAHERHDGPIIAVRGTVEKLTTAPQGETDGALLTDGTWVHWPPHQQDRFVSAIHPGDRLEAVGRNETGRRGENRFEVQSVTNLGTKDRIENPDFINEVDARLPKGPKAELESRLHQLQQQVDQLQRELKQLREGR